MDDQFFGSMVRKGMRALPTRERLVVECNDYLQRAITYIEEYFDFSDQNIFRSYKYLIWIASLHFLDMAEILPISKLVNEDALY